MLVAFAKCTRTISSPVKHVVVQVTDKAFVPQRPPLLPKRAALALRGIGLFPGIRIRLGADVRWRLALGLVGI